MKRVSVGFLVFGEYLCNDLIKVLLSAMAATLVL